MWVLLAETRWWKLISHSCREEARCNACSEHHLSLLHTVREPCVSETCSMSWLCTTPSKSSYTAVIPSVFYTIPMASPQPQRPISREMWRVYNTISFGSSSIHKSRLAIYQQSSRPYPPLHPRPISAAGISIRSPLLPPPSHTANMSLQKPSFSRAPLCHPSSIWEALSD